MMRLRLFARDDPSRQLESRVLDEGEVSIGRGAQADWAVDDPGRALSRLHLVVAVRGGMLTVRDTSTNGVFLGSPRQRPERDRPVPVSPGEPIQFGPYMLLAEAETAGADLPPFAPAPPSAPSPAATASPFGAPADRGEVERAKPRNPFGSALKADPIALDEDPAETDAWERRREYKAGDWNPAPHRRPDHSEMIGSAQAWAEPPAPAEREHGLGFDAPFTGPILREPDAPSPDAVQIPSNWDAPAPAEAAPLAADPAPQSILPVEPARPDTPAPGAAEPVAPAPPNARPSTSPAADAALFDAFCAGAHLSPNNFAGQDRAELMERLGALYRQSILGVADLMNERTALKNDFRMVRTTIRAQGNNPFKWVPPQRIAVELLRDEDGSGYVTGERALNEALHDVKAHMLCMLAGMRAALGATFDLLAPSEIEQRVSRGGFVIPGQKGAAAWNEYAELFATLRREADDSAEGPINRAFRDAYEAQLRQLDGGTGR